MSTEAKPVDPVWEAVQNAEPRTEPLSAEFLAKRERGMRDVAARNFGDVEAILAARRAAVDSGR